MTGSPVAVCRENAITFSPCSEAIISAYIILVVRELTLSTCIEGKEKMVLHIKLLYLTLWFDLSLKETSSFSLAVLLLLQFMTL